VSRVHYLVLIELVLGVKTKRVSYLDSGCGHGTLGQKLFLHFGGLVTQRQERELCWDFELF
jgi:hypothetical protein